MIEVDCFSIAFDEVPYFSTRDIAYTSQHSQFGDFYHYPPDHEGFKEILLDKNFDESKRAKLHEVLINQYEKVDANSQSIENINLLKEDNTFTIITAHQPSLFTGPLYFVYKIISVIKLTRMLKNEFPGYQFVPVFVSGGEDHDFEEINHFYFFQQKFEWQNEEGGAVGRMKTAGIENVLEQLKERLGKSSHAEEIYSILKKGISQYNRYGDFVFYLVNQLFGKYGLVYLSMDNAALKSMFVDEIKKELLHRPSQKLIESTQNKLQDLGFKAQAHAREINLFYLQKGRRDRIEYVNGQYEIVDTDIVFSESEILDKVDSSPESFSPNVALRPLYQETVCPNIAYVGGGGELAYWLERKSQFEHFGQKLPILIRRDSVEWIDRASLKTLSGLSFELMDVFREEDDLIREYIENHSTTPIDISEESTTILKLWDSIIQKASSADPTFAKSLKAEQQKLSKNLDHIAHRFIRIEKHKMENEINRIRKLKEKLFPSNGLQERKDNFLQFYIKYGDSFFDILLEQLNPLDKRLKLIVEK